MTPAMNRTTIDSRMIRLASGRSVKNPRTTKYRDAAAATVPTTRVTTWFPWGPGGTTRYEAAHSAGSVHVSPMAVTRGAETESRSHPRRFERIEMNTVAVPTTIDPSTPPRMEMAKKSHTEMECG